MAKTYIEEIVKAVATILMAIWSLIQLKKGDNE